MTVQEILMPYRGAGRVDRLALTALLIGAVAAVTLIWLAQGPDIAAPAWHGNVGAPELATVPF